MKCPNCGAPLNMARCEYCGTIDYERMRMVVFKQTKAEAENIAEQVKRLREYGVICSHNGEEVTVI